MVEVAMGTKSAVLFVASLLTNSMIESQSRRLLPHTCQLNHAVPIKMNKSGKSHQAAHSDSPRTSIPPGDAVSHSLQR